jgi:hypothetical protein
MQPQLLHQANVAGHSLNYYEPLDDDDYKTDNKGHYTFTITSAASTPSISFSLMVQIQTFDPKCATLQDSPDLCEGVLIPDIWDLPGSPGSPYHKSLRTQDIAVDTRDDTNGISASLSSF